MKMATTLEGVYIYIYKYFNKINNSYTLVKSAVSFVNENIENKIEDSFKKCA